MHGRAFAATGLAGDQRQHTAEELQQCVAQWQVALMQAQSFHDVDHADAPVRWPQWLHDEAQQKPTQQWQPDDELDAQALEILRIPFRKQFSQRKLDARTEA